LEEVPLEAYSASGAAAAAGLLLGAACYRRVCRRRGGPPAKGSALITLPEMVSSISTEYEVKQEAGASA